MRHSSLGEKRLMVSRPSHALARDVVTGLNSLRFNMMFVEMFVPKKDKSDSMTDPGHFRANGETQSPDDMAFNLAIK